MLADTNGSRSVIVDCELVNYKYKDLGGVTGCYVFNSVEEGKKAKSTLISVNGYDVRIDKVINTDSILELGLFNNWEQIIYKDISIVPSYSYIYKNN